MGYDASAVAVIGIRHDPGVIKAKLYQKSIGRACGHPINEGQKFCPECGAPATKEFTDVIDAYDEENEVLCGYKLVHRGEGHYDDPEFIAYWTSGQVDRNTVRSITSTLWGTSWSDVREEMKAKLEPLGLYDERGFGLHVFLYESC